MWRSSEGAWSTVRNIYKCIITFITLEVEVCFDNFYILHFVFCRYQVPCDKTLKSVMTTMYLQTKSEIKSLLRQNIEFASLTTDTWTSVANDGFIAITAHGINNEWELVNYTLAVQHLNDRHTGDYLSHVISEVASEHSIQDPICTTDSGANIKCAIKLNGWARFPCFAHTFNLGVQAGLEARDVSTIVDKVKSLVAFFKHSSVAYTKLKEAASKLSQKQCRFISW